MSKKKMHCLTAHLLWGFLWLFNCQLNSPSVSPRGFWRKRGEEPSPGAARHCEALRLPVLPQHRRSAPREAKRSHAGAACPQQLPISLWDKMRGQLTPELLVIFVFRKGASRPAQLSWCRSPHAILHLWSHTASVWVLTHP